MPAASVGSELARRGHEVAWATYSLVEQLLPEAGKRYCFTSAMQPDDVLRNRETSGGRWMAGLKAFWTDVMLPMNREMRPQVDSAIQDFRPDVVVADQQAVAGALAARRAGVPWATSAATFAWASSIDSLPSVKAWIDGQLDGLQREAGLEPVRQPDLSPDLVLAYTVPELAGPARGCRAFRFVGPPVDARVEQGDFPWEQLDARKKVFLSLGTVSHYRGEEFLRAAVEALAEEPLQVIVTAPRGMLSAAPPNFIVREWVPQVALLQKVDAVVCNAGFSTTGEALAHGVPLVLAPIAYDSSIVAERVAAAGAGVRVRFYRCTAAELRAAVRQVLDEPGYRHAAEALQQASRLAGGAGAAVDALEATFRERWDE
jgi:UDP:flavonoid glycosyltransferase YjiC (YdhE family)